MLIVQRGVRGEWRSYIDPGHFDAMLPVLRLMRPIFPPFGSFEAHGCSLGSVPRTRDLLRRLANVGRPPVSASPQLHAARK